MHSICGCFLALLLQKTDHIAPTGRTQHIAHLAAQDETPRCEIAHAKLSCTTDTNAANMQDAPSNCWHRTWTSFDWWHHLESQAPSISNPAVPVISLIAPEARSEMCSRVQAVYISSPNSNLALGRHKSPCEWFAHRQTHQPLVTTSKAGTGLLTL